MIKDLIGTVLGRREAMYRFIYYHTFKRFILTYLLFAFLYSLILLIDAAVILQYIPGMNLLLYYFFSLYNIISTIILLGLFLSAVAIIIFILAKIFRKNANFGQLFLAMHSIAPFFLIIKLMFSLAIAFGNLIPVATTFHILFLLAIIYFIIIIAKTASYFTTFNFFQTIIIMLLIVGGILAILYLLYLQLMANIPFLDLTNETYSALNTSLEGTIQESI